MILILSLATFLVACGETSTTAGEFGILNENDPIVEILFNTGDKVRVELYPETAPVSVKNFLKYVNDGFYNGLAFHRIIKGFMIQTGGFYQESNYMVQKPATYPAIYGEFKANGCEYNTVEHLKGVISMARTQVNDSATSQFFFCTVDNYPTLNDNYAPFGRVIDQESMDVLLTIEAIPTTTGVMVYDKESGKGYYTPDMPTKVVSIQNITIIKNAPEANQ